LFIDPKPSPDFVHFKFLLFNVAVGSGQADLEHSHKLFNGDEFSFGHFGNKYLSKNIILYQKLSKEKCARKYKSSIIVCSSLSESPSNSFPRIFLAFSSVMPLCLLSSIIASIMATTTIFYNSYIPSQKNFLLPFSVFFVPKMQTFPFEAR
jgi:hypothetical protein